MNIYFDGTLINNDYVTGISFDGKSFNSDEIFSLGSTICNNIQLTISKDLATKPQSNVEIQNLGIFNIDNVQENETNYIYTLVDNMINFNFRYDAQPLIETSSHTETDGTKYVYLIELLDDICLKAGTELKTRTFLGYQKHISYYDNTILAREYLSMVAELNSGYAIDNNGIYLKQYTNTPIETILLENCSQYKIGEKHTITRVAMDNGVFEPVGTDDGNTVYLNTNNVFITEQQDLINIYNVINGFEFYSIEASKGDITVSSNTIGECIAFSDGTNLYKAYKQVNATYNGGWNGKYSFTIGSIYQEETAEYNGIKDNYTRLKVITDRNNKQIGLLAEQKLDSDEYTKAEIVARINDNTSQVKIEADSIDLNGVVTANNNFKILLDGSMECKNASINGGDIILNDEGNLYNPSFKIINAEIDYNAFCNQYSDLMSFDSRDIANGKDTSIVMGTYNFPFITLNESTIQGSTTTSTYTTHITAQGISFIDHSNNKMTSIAADGIIAPNIQSGTASITNANTGTTITFNTPFDTVPNVVLTPITTASGAVSIKIIEITTTYFKAYNSTSQSVDACWIAMN